MEVLALARDSTPSGVRHSAIDGMEATTVQSAPPAANVGCLSTSDRH